jgi:hypothetical protein
LDARLIADFARLTLRGFDWESGRLVTPSGVMEKGRPEGSIATVPLGLFAVEEKVGLSGLEPTNEMPFGELEISVDTPTH